MEKIKYNIKLLQLIILTFKYELHFCIIKTVITHNRTSYKYTKNHISQLITLANKYMDVIDILLASGYNSFIFDAAINSVKADIAFIIKNEKFWE